MDWNIAGAASDILGGIFQTGYNIYTNHRDFDYQKALQKQIFEREDNAVQRRMADLQAAGLNPNLAAGSAAGAGSIVARSNTNDINVGSALDSIQAVNQIRMQKQQTENAKVENAILNTQRDVADMNKQITLAETMYQLGLPIRVTTNKLGDKWNIRVKLDDPEDGSFTWKNEKPLLNYLDYQMQNQKNSADMIQKQNNWYTTNQVLNSVGSVIGDITDIGGLFKPKFYKGKFVK